MAEKIKITLAKSLIGSKPKQRLNAEALGLKKLNSSVIQKDNPAIRGMIKQISHLVKITEI